MLGLIAVSIGPLLLLGAAALAFANDGSSAGAASELLVLSIPCGLHVGVALAAVVVSRRTRRRLAAQGSIQDRGMRAATSMGILGLVVGLVMVGAVVLGPFRGLQVEWACDMRGLSMPAIVARTDHSHPRVRWSALRALANAGTAEAFEALLSVVHRPADDGSGENWIELEESELLLMDAVAARPENADRLVTLLESGELPTERGVYAIEALQAARAAHVGALARLVHHRVYRDATLRCLTMLATHVPSHARPPFKCSHGRRWYEFDRRIDPAAPAAARAALAALAAEGTTAPGWPPAK